MNNQIPYVDNYYFGPNPNYNQNINYQIERLNNRLNRLERQVKILENRVNRIVNNQGYSNTYDDDNNNMYML